MEIDDAREFPDLEFEPIGPRIRQRREALGLSREERVARLGGTMSIAAIERLEQDRVLFPSWIRLMQLAEALESTAEAPSC